MISIMTGLGLRLDMSLQDSQLVVKLIDLLVAFNQLLQ